MYIYIYIYIYILSRLHKRWESFWVVSVGHAPAQQKRNGNVEGNAPETLTGTLRKLGRKRCGNVDGNVAETWTET